MIYREFKLHIFPKLLESPSVLPEDKQRIRELLKKALESIHQKAFSFNRKIDYSQGARATGACWLVWEFSDAPQIFALFWK